MASTRIMMIRNVDSELHKSLKIRAAVEGKSMNSLVIEILRNAIPVKRGK